MKKLLRVGKPFKNFMPGDVAGFEEVEAAELVKSGIAAYTGEDPHPRGYINMESTKKLLAKVVASSGKADDSVMPEPEPETEPEPEPETETVPEPGVDAPSGDASSGDAPSGDVDEAPVPSGRRRRGR